MLQQFPDGFLWGVASAGHQNEGGNVDSDTWFAEHVTPTVFREPSGQACNGWELWREDVDLAAGMNLNSYRFSVEWARVEPAEGEFSAEALGHYAAIAGHCLARGLAPVVTFNHFTSPHWFAMRAGWLNPEAPGAVRQVLRPGDGRVRRQDRRRGHAERAGPARHAGLVGAAAGGARAGARHPGGGRRGGGRGAVPDEQRGAPRGAGRDLRRHRPPGHRAARAAIKARRPELPVGFALAIVDDQVYGDDPSLRDRKRAEVYQRWLELAREDDFIAIQNYERLYYDAERSVNRTGRRPRAGR